jgi:hypothetical protein
MRPFTISANSNMSRFFSFFLVIFLAWSGVGKAAASNIYLVENVTTSVTSKSPAMARSLAVAGARRDAFLILLTRLELNTNIADSITDEEISDMVRSEQVDNEKIAGNSYSATFNILFAKDFVDHILAKKNLSKPTETEQKYEETYLLIPVKMLHRKVILWEEDNDWKKAIEKNLKKSKGKFVVPAADISDIGFLNRETVANADYSTLEPLLSKYKSDAAYTLFFSYDEVENKVTINVSYIRKLQKKQIKLSFVNVDRLSYGALLDKVAFKTLDYISSNQILENKTMSTNLVRIKIPITSLGNWLMIKNKIESSNLVSQLNIESLSRDYAVISVNYTDTRTSIAEAFFKIGLILEKKSENFYILTN